MLGRSALLAATNPLDYGNWLGNYSDVSLLLRGNEISIGVNPPVDESPTPKTITAVGNASVTTAAAKWNQGSGGSSLVFDGSGDQFTAANINANNADLTVECWLRLNAYPSNFGIIACTYSGTTTATQLNTFIFAVSSTGTVSASGAFGSGATTATIPLNTWAHVAFVYTHSNQTRTAYLNGVAGAPYSSESLTNTAVTSLFIGGSSGALNIGTWWLNGYIDDFRITKGFARYQTGTGANAGQMVFNSLDTRYSPNTLAYPVIDSGTQFPNNNTGDPYYTSNVSLLLRNGTPLLVPLDESPIATRKTITAFGNAGISITVFKYGVNSLIFDGNGDSLRANHPDLPGDWTAEAWLYLNSLTGSIFSFGNSSGSPQDGFYILIDSGLIQVNDGITPVANFSLESFSLGQWIHLAVCRQSGVNRGFVNGRIAGSNTVNRAATISFVSVGQFAANVAPFNFFNGFMDDVRITVGVSRYNSSFTPPPAELPNF